MASKKSRTRAHRRDRHKAKASGWKREGQTQMGHVGHGVSGSSGPKQVTTKLVSKATKQASTHESSRPVPMRVSLGELYTLIRLEEEE
jgi:hypothetical protein